VTRDITNFKDLKLWQRGMAFVKRTYRYTKKFLLDERLIMEELDAVSRMLRALTVKLDVRIAS